MIAREAVEAIQHDARGKEPGYLMGRPTLDALLGVVVEADRLTDLLGEFSFDGGACGEQADRLDSALVRLRDVAS